MDDSDALDAANHDPSELASTPSWPGAPAGAPPARSNTFSTKIQTILASSHSDIGIRDALETLDARNTHNDAATRRNLRLDVTRDIIDSNAAIVRDFAQVAQQLQTVGAALEKLQRTCVELRKHISTAHTETAPMLDEADALLAQKAQLAHKQALLDAVRAHFLLSDDEHAALTSSAAPVTNLFFAALVKAKRIRADCRVLLSGGDGGGGGDQQRLGLDLLETSSRHLNAAYPKLYRWVQREFKALDLENPQISTGIRRALRVLAERPTLFQNCLDAFAEAREHSLSDAFYSALTGSAAEKGGEVPAKPLEMTAHEPLRYIGDMLAWAHSATVSEREALEVLFISEGDEIAKSIREGLEEELWSRSEEVEVFDGRKALNQLVNRDLTGIARQLRQRIEQVIHSHDEAVLAYKIANLIGFYRNIFRKFLDSDSSFLETLAWLESSAVNQFRKTMEFHIKAIQGEGPVAPEDLATPDFLDEALDELRLLLKSYDTSVASTAQSPADDSLRLVLAEALQPYLELCGTLADALPEPAASIFAVNCLLAAKEPLALYPFAAPKAAELDAAIATHAATLTDAQHAFFRSASGLEPLLAVLGLPNANPRTHAAFAPDALAAASAALDAFLPAALMDAAARLKRLRSGPLVNDITGAAADRFCADFEGLEDALEAADAAAPAAASLRALFPRTGAEIGILLS